MHRCWRDCGAVERCNEGENALCVSGPPTLSTGGRQLGALRIGLEWRRAVVSGWACAALRRRRGAGGSKGRNGVLRIEDHCKRILVGGQRRPCGAPRDHRRGGRGKGHRGSPVGCAMRGQARWGAMELCGGALVGHTHPCLTCFLWSGLCSFLRLQVPGLFILSFSRPSVLDIRFLIFHFPRWVPSQGPWGSRVL